MIIQGGTSWSTSTASAGPTSASAATAASRRSNDARSGRRRGDRRRHGAAGGAGVADAYTHMQLLWAGAGVRDDFGSGTAAAAVGGTTTIVDYVTAYRGETPAALRRGRAGPSCRRPTTACT